MGSAIPPSVILGSVIRSYLVLTKIRFTSGNATGLKNPKNTRTGITDLSGKPEFYAYNEHIWWDGPLAREQWIIIPMGISQPKVMQGDCIIIRMQLNPTPYLRLPMPILI